MNLLIGNILELDPIAGVISQVRTLVQWFKTQHAPLHELGEKQQHFLGKSITLAHPCKTRWQSHMDCLRLVLDSKVALKSMVLEPKVRRQLEKRLKNNTTGPAVLEMIKDSAFWKVLDQAKIIIEPFVKVIISTEKNTPQPSSPKYTERMVAFYLILTTTSQRIFAKRSRRLSAHVSTKSPMTLCTWQPCWT